MTDARELLRDLVETPSVSGEERAVAERLVSYFEAHGREAYLDDVGNVRAPADDGVLLTSHMDTVPGDIPVREASGELWGRGACDAKGPLAAMAVAAARAGVSFVGVVGEETSSRGARHLVETRDQPEAVINGEPSGWDAVTLGYRGFVKGRFAGETPSAHTSRPGPNALEHAMDWWHDVEETFEAGSESSVFEQVTTKPVEMDGGVSADGLAFEATVEVQLRVPPSLTVEEVRATVEGALPTYVGEEASVAVEWTDAIPPVMESPRNGVAAALRAGIRAEGGETTHLRKTGTSDMNVYRGAWDCPMATYGPGDSSLDHAPDERIDLEEYDRGVAVLTAAAERLQ
ncbi:N-acetyl-lysine deacetylase [Halarchaeum grantii]|uniref:Putative [LysW]-lysine/[LysW]-ornithine hydrolase n=1 Tax=Halarchaeum grantii TaxID=1193105 RepID=A0A830EXV5_9EURY|nr:[LysW]-lysine hydrolase [Halarchaeum grantii]GGL35340.1 N-acetyl-lysine deacetylase [Halarchaeum grantii]